MPLTRQDVQAEIDRRTLRQSVDAEIQRRTAGGVPSSPVGNADTASPYTPMPVPTGLPALDVVRGLSGMATRASEWLQNKTVNKTMPALEQMQNESPPGLNREAYRRRRQIQGVGKFFMSAPGFINQFVNPASYGVSPGTAAVETGRGFLGAVKQLPAQIGEDIRQTTANMGVNEPNPLQETYSRLGADQTYQQAVDAYNADPSAPINTALMVEGGIRGAAGLARKAGGVVRGLRDTRQPVNMIDNAASVSPAPVDLKGALDAEIARRKRMATPEELAQLQQPKPTEVLNDTQNATGQPSGVIKGQAPVETQPVPSGGKEATQTGGVVQAPSGEIAPAPVEGKGTVLYHGTKENFPDAEITGGKGMYGIHLTTDESAAKNYGSVKKYTLSRDAKTLDLSDGSDLWQFMEKRGILDAEDVANPDLRNYVESGQIYQYDISSKTSLADDVARTAKSLGYDVVKMPDNLGGSSDNIAYVVVNKKVLKSPAPVAAKQPPVKAPSPVEAAPVEGAVTQKQGKVRVLKDATGNELVDLNGEPIRSNADGTITLYHRTTPENATKIKNTGAFKSLENADETYFSNKPKGQADGYGDAIVEVRVKPSDVEINDAFRDGEIHVTVKNVSLSKAKIAPAPVAAKPKLGPKGKAAIALGVTGAGVAAYQAMNPQQRKDVSAAALGIGLLGTGLMRSRGKEGGGGNEPAYLRAMREEKTLTEKPFRQPKLTGNETPESINLDKMNLAPEEKAQAQRIIAQMRPSLERRKGQKMTDAEVIQHVQEVDMIQGAISRDATLKQSAQVLKARMNEAALLKRPITRGADLVNLIDGLKAVETFKTDAGRQLQKLSIESDPVMQTSQAMLLKRLSKEGISSEFLQAKADEYIAAGKDLNNPKWMLKFYREFIEPKKSEILDEFRYINMLSSPNTHIVNTSSNLIQAAILRPGTRLVAGGVDFVGSALTGSERRYYTAQVPAYYKGMINSYGDAVKAFTQAMTGELATLRPDLEHIPTNSKLTAWGTPITRAMEAEDVFVRTLIEGGEREALAVKYKKLGKPLDFEAIDREAKQTAAELVFRKQIDATNASGQGKFLSAIDASGNMIMGLRRSVPGIKWLIPFVMTPLNIAKQGIEYSPAGFLTMVGSADKTLQFSKATVGSTVFAGAGYLAMSGKTTWAIPKNQKDKEAFYAAGMKPYSIKIGKTWVSYSKLGPLAYPIAFASALRYHFQNSPSSLTDSDLEKLTAGVGEMAQFFSDQSYVQSLGNVLNVIEKGGSGEWAGDVSQLVSGSARQLIPLAALQGWVNGMIDPIYRKSPKGLTPGAIWQNMERNIVGLSTQNEPYLDANGQPSQKPYPVGNAFSPFPLAPENASGEQGFNDQTALGQRTHAYNTIMNLVSDGKNASATSIINKLNAQGFDVPSLDIFQAESGRREANKVRDAARPERPARPGKTIGAPSEPQSAVPALPEIYGMEHLDSIPKNLTVRVNVIHAKTGKRVEIKQNARQTVEELTSELADLDKMKELVLG